MPRREYYLRPQCVHDGCTERAFYAFDRRADQERERKWLDERGGWRCVRHTKPDEVLSEDAPIREVVLVSRQESYGRFWAPEGATTGGSGFIYGPGFKAYADDFPPGTRITVTATIALAGEDR